MDNWYIFSISANDRFNSTTIKESVQSMFEEYIPIGLLIRDLLQTDHKSQGLPYSEVVTSLNNIALMAPVYFIAGGVKASEGMIVTRNETYSFFPLSLFSNTTYDNGNGGWFLVQTNDDYWMPPHDNRRDTAIEALNNVGQNNINNNTLFQVLSTKPVQNAGTVFTSIMSAKNYQYFSVVIREYDW